MRTDRILVAGETLVDLFPSGPGDLATVDGFVHRAGGAPANVATGLARLDSPPEFWTRLGDDAFGAYLRDVLADHGLDGEFVVAGDAATALAVVSPTPDGDRSFTFYEADTATLAFETGAVPDHALARFDCVHVGGVALTNDAGRDATLDLLERAFDARCLVSFDPNTRPDLWSDPKAAGDALRDALDLADLLFCSPDDLQPLGLGERARSDPEAAAAELLDYGPETVFLTRGEDGATVVSDLPDGERVTRSESAFDVDVVDTTGAGDAFTAGALAAYEPGMDGDALGDVLRFANATAALTTTETGGMTALPDDAAVRALLDGRASEST
ncbi:carbohydrate kinase family protein [Halobacterium sp. KA-6]|uniref:carbohydrate kinase family protein n=1 Tax=Halobacterium sp. KA-6 TaxID=2896368 RepID=UPI001E37E025|nr:carbohydrate kinase [Halobacterium sp. KA-6]MCD2201920.1 carbohydrate kinase [Halobacterium sp. KA-6]